MAAYNTILTIDNQSMSIYPAILSMIEKLHRKRTAISAKDLVPISQAIQQLKTTQDQLAPPKIRLQKLLSDLPNAL